MVDFMSLRRADNYDKVDDAVLGNLKIYAPDLIYPLTRFPLRRLKGMPPLDQSLKIDEKFKGVHLIRKLQDLAWVLIMHGADTNLWGDMLFLYLSPELKRRVRVRLNAKNPRSMRQADCWLHSLIALTERVNFETYRKNMLDLIEAVNTNYGDPLTESLFTVISLAQELPDEVALPKAKLKISYLTKRMRSYNSGCILNEQSFQKSLTDIKSCQELRQLISENIKEGALVNFC
ncbi:hypothetical protein DASC09_043020 [Saccharomycopsis crataegensis]|uniref:Uncharacterized protein n=1 Tax=Saccharomycopsis crataegensis TaxID=43959 RepID=A0AAV5QQV2_9ASCO|nr:hypothetical protein DASC09_043020 [Saccharomycopsis crataegensis]